MTLEEFINIKTQQLKEKYKDVKFAYAIDVKVSKNRYEEMLTAGNTPLSKQVKEIESFLNLPNDDDTLNYQPNGSRAVFEVKAPKKRKYEDVEFFVQWVE